jgi:hypothetical protein
LALGTQYASVWAASSITQTFSIQKNNLVIY